MEISKIAQIESGYKLLPRTVAKNAGGAWRVLQLRDVGDHGRIMWHLVRGSAESSLLSASAVRAGDVLFAPRSPRVNALMLGREVDDHPTAASSHFYIVRTDTGRLDPGYLVWFLNHPRTKRVLEAENRGTHLPFLPIQALRQLDVPLPPIERQRHIAHVDELTRCESELTADLLAEYTTLRAESTWHAVHSNTNSPNA